MSSLKQRNAKYIVAIDQGTTGTTVALVSASSFKFIDKVTNEFPQIYPAPGRVEHNLNDIWKSVTKGITKIISKNKINAKNIMAIGITNQRETVCAFDSKGTPLANAIVWQDRRTADFCNNINQTNPALAARLKELTGLPLDPYFSASKIKWLIENNAKVQKIQKTGNNKNFLHFGNIDTYLLYQLSGGTAFATEASNASRTMLMNLRNCKWDDELLNFFKVDKNFLPEIKNSFGLFGHTKKLKILPDGIPIAGILGDQQAALFGQAGFSAGDLKCTYGTGAFLLLNCGTNIVNSNKGLLSTVAFLKDGVAHYALEGSCYIAGAAVQWIRDNLKLIKKSSEIENLAKKVRDLSQLEHLLFLPFFTGIGSPYWNASAKGAILGITRDTRPEHLARATLDGIALSVNDLIQAIRQEISSGVITLSVDGGAAANNLLMEIQATVSGLKIIRPKIIETTAYGAALAAAIGVGIFSMEEIRSLWSKEREFIANDSWDVYYRKKKERWSKIIQSGLL